MVVHKTNTPTLDNFALYQRFITGTTIDEALIKYKEMYKNSEYGIIIIDEIVNEEFKNLAYANQNTYMEYIKKCFPYITIDFYSTGGAVLPEESLIKYYKKVIDYAKKYKTQILTFSSPEQKFFEKYKQIRLVLAKYAGNFPIYFSQPAYHIDAKKEIDEVKKVAKCVKIALICGGFRIKDTNNSKIIGERQAILEKYIELRNYCININIKILDQTNNKDLINQINPNIIQYHYNVNNLDELFPEIKKIVLLVVAPDYKRSNTYAIRKNNESTSHES